MAHHNHIIFTDFTINGTEGNDRIDYLSHPDSRVFASQGEPGGTIYGHGGHDDIEGWNGDDRLYGGAGDDELASYGGNDELYGGPGDDLLRRGPFRGDKLFDGGPGADMLRGGNTDFSYESGVDTFIFRPGDSVDGGGDVIDDFDAGDRILIYGFGKHELTITGLINVPWGRETAGPYQGWAGSNNYSSYHARIITLPDGGKITLLDVEDVPFSAIVEGLKHDAGGDLLITEVDAGGGDTDGDDDDPPASGGADDDPPTSGGGDDTPPAAGRQNGTAGNDQLTGGPGDDDLRGYGGDDVLNGGAGDDRLAGMGGTDRIIGGPGADTGYGGEGDDDLRGDSGDDRLFGGGGNDYIDGWTGDDWIQGGSGDDELWGDEGDDRLFGGSSDDSLAGEEGDDELYGGSGDDELYGDEGDDWIQGGSGDDVLAGYTGNDTFVGGAGEDVFVFGPGDSRGRGDVIRDYTEDDTIDISLYEIDDDDVTITEEGADTIITLPGNNTITLLDYPEGQIYFDYG